MEFLKSYFGSLEALFMCVLFIALGLPLAYRKIKRNYWYGFRMSYTLQDDEIWYEVNAMTGRHLVVLGIVMGIVGIASMIIANGRTPQSIKYIHITPKME